MSDLLPVEESLSPKLWWLKRHDLTADKTDHGTPRCRNAAHTRFGLGHDEDEAILDYCKKYGIKHWLVEAHEMDPDQGSVNFD